ncbi:MAG: type 1 glutamine amidotransferase [Rubrivivax sp.]|nr:type 1 glutamine amidotransferase [Rubrivivax sp.]
MRPVLILQHLSSDGPAYLGTWLTRQGVAFDVFDTEAGHAYPEDLVGYGALAILGGEMSANDALPSLRQAEVLFLQALAAGVPTLGHCLGGQLMARALGAPVTAATMPEIGWQPVQVVDSAGAAAWFGPPGERRVFEWHSETFALPAGAELLAGSAACTHQAFALGPHLAMQFHVEADAEKIHQWANDADPQDDVAPRLRTMQGPATMRAGVAEYLAGQQALADRIYTRWLELARNRQSQA